MSNASLQQNLRQLCTDYQTGALPLRELARQVAVHAEAFEAFPFANRKELEQVAFDLERQADYADEGCEYQTQVAKILSSLEASLLRIQT